MHVTQYQFNKRYTKLDNITLNPIGGQFKEVANNFEVITFTYIFRELNGESYLLSKVELQLEAFLMVIEEDIDVNIIIFFKKKLSYVTKSELC